MTRVAAQRHRINRAINFIHDNLLDDIRLDDMAEAACLSRYHFLRVFQRHCNESPARYLWRSRLEHATRMLMFQPDQTVGSVALASGFDSHHSFSRAFARRFGMPPSALERSPFGPSPMPAPLNDVGNFSLPTERLPIDESAIRVQRVPAIRLAYLRFRGPYLRNGERVRHHVNLLRKWCLETGRANTDERLFGLLHDNRRVTPSAFCRYDIGVPVPGDTVEDETVSIMTIPAGRYAIARVHHDNAQMLGAWEWLSYDWRRERAMPYRQMWSYEIYRPRLDGTVRPEDGIDICLRLSD